MMMVLKHPTPTSSFKTHLIINTNNNNTNNKPTLIFFNIASHNTRSLLDSLKQQLLVDLYSINHLDIIAVQETNFTTPTHHFPLKSICNNKYMSFFSTNPDTQHSGFGVGFLVKKHLTD